MVSLKKCVARAGAEADLERAMPYLYRLQPDGKVKEAILDVVVSSAGCLQTMPFDVTIRCPRGLKDYHGTPFTAIRPAEAARDGEQEKSLRYDDPVIPLAFET